VPPSRTNALVRPNNRRTNAERTRSFLPLPLLLSLLRLCLRLSLSKRSPQITLGPPVEATAESPPKHAQQPAPITSPRLQRASASLGRSIPPACRWCHLDAPEPSARVYVPAIGMAKSVCHESHVCLMGTSRAGKTSLAVAMLRAWVARYERAAMFVPTHRAEKPAKEVTNAQGFSPGRCGP
jgi:hypothetical protein